MLLYASRCSTYFPTRAISTEVVGFLIPAIQFSHSSRRIFFSGRLSLLRTRVSNFSLNKTMGTSYIDLQSYADMTDLDSTLQKRAILSLIDFSSFFSDLQIRKSGCMP